MPKQDKRNPNLKKRAIHVGPVTCIATTENDHTRIIRASCHKHNAENTRRPYKRPEKNSIKNL